MAEKPHEKRSEPETREHLESKDLDEQILRSQMLVNERERTPANAGGMPKSPIENVPVWRQPGGNPPPEDRAHDIDAPPRSHAQLEREEERLQYKGT